MTFNEFIDQFVSYFSLTTTTGIISFSVCLLFAILTIVAMWKLFTKAGEKGWKAIIPIYDLYILCKLVWSKKAFWYLVLIFFLAFACSTVFYVVGEAAVVVRTIMTIVSLVLAICEFIFYIVLDIKTSYAYGHGAGFAIGLIFLNVVFIWILGFGSSKYVGNKE